MFASLQIRIGLDKANFGCGHFINLIKKISEAKKSTRIFIGCIENDKCELDRYFVPAQVRVYVCALVDGSYITCFQFNFSLRLQNCEKEKKNKKETERISKGIHSKLK